MSISAITVAALPLAPGLLAPDALAVLTGVGTGLGTPAAAALLADLVPAQLRVQRFAVQRLAVNLGCAAGPAAAGPAAAGLALIPWAPLAQGGLDRNDGPLSRIATSHNVSIGQVALAWLLAVSPNIVPIPGTSQRAHLEENLAAAQLRLSTDEIAELTAATNQQPLP